MATVREWVASHDSDRAPALEAVAPSDVTIVIVDSDSHAGSERAAGGAQFGSLVHAILAEAPLDAARETLENVAAIQARLLSGSDDEIASAVDAAARVLQHELLLRARAASREGACRRETPVTWTASDGTLVEGVVDLAFEEHDEWFVLDYKTDREFAGRGEEQYRRQVALYATAVAAATGRRAHGVLMRI